MMMPRQFGMAVLAARQNNLNKETVTKTNKLKEFTQ